MQHVIVQRFGECVRCIYLRDWVIARAEFNRMKRNLTQSTQREILCWHSAATRWPVNANFNNSLIIVVSSPLDHFYAVWASKPEKRGRKERQWDRNSQYWNINEVWMTGDTAGEGRGCWRWEKAGCKRQALKETSLL